MKFIRDGNIYLLGFMGSGKSTIGPLLAKKLNLAFFDTDEFIENKTAKSISQIFIEEGENSFREQERWCIDLASQMTQFVIAVGGGAILSSDNWIKIYNSGITIYLKCPFKVIWDRIKNCDTRPLLSMNVNDRYRQVKDLLTSRAPFYERADVLFDCMDGESPASVVNRLVERLEGFL